jgi:tRNA pseudouridine38-40 synthase
MRYFITFSYQGSSYHGWQRQPDASSVQQTLEEAMKLFLKEDVSLVGAGRTDTGVHAKVMVAHFDTQQSFEIEELIYRLNAYLDESIAILSIVEVKADAHARFDATSRSYEYWVVQQKNPFLAQAAYYITYPLDVNRMNEAAALMLEHKDFECFSKSNTDVHTYLCDVTRAEWVFEGERLVFHVSANRFLRNMVRAIVGTLLEVGKGKMSIDEFKAVLNSKDRRNAGPSVPAKGLYLTTIQYPY